MDELYYEAINALAKQMIKGSSSLQERRMIGTYAVVTGAERIHVMVRKAKTPTTELIGLQKAVDDQRKAERGCSPGYGWKLHVSVDETIPENLARAWNLTVALIEKHGIPAAKVVREGFYASDGDKPGHSTQSNKQITIYLGPAPIIRGYMESNIIPFIYELNHALVSHGVRPASTIPPGSNEKSLGGSNYLAYRNDRDAKGNYVDSVKNPALPEGGFNLGRDDDLFERLSLELRGGVAPSTPDDYRRSVEAHRKAAERPEPPEKKCCCAIM